MPLLPTPFPPASFPFPFTPTAARASTPFATFLTTVVPVDVFDAALTVRLSFLATVAVGSAPLFGRVIGAGFAFCGALAGFAAAARVRVARGFSVTALADDAAAVAVASTAAALAGDVCFGGAG